MVYSYLSYLQFNCLLCGLKCQPSSGIHGLCQHCHNSLPHLAPSQCCRQCALPLADSQARYCGHCQHTPPAFDSSCAAVAYSDAVVPLISTLKNQCDRAHITMLAQLLCQQIQRLPNWPQLHAQIDVLIPCPMHWQRNRQRGNNHSLLLAETIAKTLKIPIQRHMVSSTKATHQQKALKAKDRHKNLRGVFTVNQQVQQQHIAIIDDVMTTTATMNSISDGLKKAGAASVHAWSVARTPQPGRRD